MIIVRFVLRIRNAYRVQFIADIRGARVRELEEKRINKEMANIRKKFKGQYDSLRHGRWG